MLTFLNWVFRALEPRIVKAVNKATERDTYILRAAKPLDWWIGFDGSWKWKTGHYALQRNMVAFYWGSLTITVAWALPTSK